MTKLTILIKYDGKWVNSAYKGGKTKALVVSDNVTYEELLAKLYGLVRVEPNEFGIIIKAVYCGKSRTYPVEVVDGDDVAAFICESLARDWKIPLCITLERRALASGRGSNQCAAIGLATQTTKSHMLDPHAGLEEQDSIAFDSDPLLVNFNSGTQENTDSGDGLILDDFANDKQNDNREVDVEHNSLQRDDMPYDNMQYDEVPRANLQFDNLPHDNMQFDGVLLNRPNSQPFTRYSGKATEGMVSTMLNMEGDIGLHSSYPSKKDLQKKLSIAAMKDNFEFKVKRSTRKIYVVECVNDDCTWRLRAVKSPDECFTITKYDSRHSCSLDSCSLDAIHHSHRQASLSLVGEYVKSKYKGVSCQFKPKDIIEDIRKDLGVNITYTKARRASQRAFPEISGSPKEISSTRRPYKRRKKEGIQPHGENQSTRKCRKCGETGHYRRTCKNPITRHLNVEVSVLP